MKKNIQKKFMFEFKLPDEVMTQLEASGNGIPIEEVAKLKKFPKDLIGYLITEKGYFFKSFPYLYQGNIRFIPEPDPVLVYFHSAYVNYRLIDEKKKVILKALLEPKMPEPMMNELYQYFSLTSGFIIFLFTAMEAFINRSIPANYTYTKPGTKNTEVYTKKQIEEFLSFKEKMTMILPVIAAKNFEKKYPMKYQHITNLKEYRDSIIHTKSGEENTPSFDYLYKKALDFKFEDTINAVADFCNFYHPQGNYITECECENNW